MYWRKTYIFTRGKIEEEKFQLILTTCRGFNKEIPRRIDPSFICMRTSQCPSRGRTKGMENRNHEKDERSGDYKTREGMFEPPKKKKKSFHSLKRCDCRLGSKMSRWRQPSETTNQ